MKQRYDKNPFVQQTREVTKAGLKPVLYSSADGALTVFNRFTGEVEGAAIAVKRTVDRAQFVKLYAAGVAAILNLKASGKRVFALLYMEMTRADNINADRISLGYNFVDAATRRSMSRTTYYRGLRECIEAQILAPSKSANIYFINPAFLFNGSRITFLSQYDIEDDGPQLTSSGAGDSLEVAFRV